MEKKIPTKLQKESLISTPPPSSSNRSMLSETVWLKKFKGKKNIENMQCNADYRWYTLEYTLKICKFKKKDALFKNLTKFNRLWYISSQVLLKTSNVELNAKSSQ